MPWALRNKIDLLRLSFRGTTRQARQGVELGWRCSAQNSRFSATVIIPSSMELGLKNRVAIIAASSQGIGKATAEAFAAEGCRVAMCARNSEALRQAAEKIKSQYGVDVYSEAFDVTDASSVKRFVEAVANKFGSLHICVTNAGGPPAKSFLATTQEDWNRAVDTNLLSTIFV